MRYERREKPRLEHEKSRRLNKREREERRIERRVEKHRRRYELRKQADAELMAGLNPDDREIIGSDDEF